MIPNRLLPAFGALICLLVQPMTVGSSSASATSWNGGLAEPPRIVEACSPNAEARQQLATAHGHWRQAEEPGCLILEVAESEIEGLRRAGLRVAVLEEGTPRDLSSRGAGGGIPGFGCFRTVEETLSDAQALAVAHPGLATWVDIGDSWEKTVDPTAGYDLQVLVLTNGSIAGPKPALMVLAGIHGREYSTPELALRFAEMLLAGYGVDAEVTWLLDHHEIHILPQSNPDSRKRAEGGLFWRKNTNNNFCPNSDFRGVDLNRNYDFQWGCCGGSSTDPCSVSFRGTAAGSEPETAALQAYLRALFPDQRPNDLTTPAPDDATGLLLDLHSFGHRILWSWGFDTTPPPNSAQITTLGRKLSFFDRYEPFPGSRSTVDGAAKDFGYGELGVASYTVEMGATFFESCSYYDRILAPADLDMLLYAAKVARTPYQTPAGPEAVGLETSTVALSAGSPALTTVILDDTRFSTRQGSEPSQDIVAAELYVDLPPWAAGATALAMSPADGLFDSAVEGATLSVDTTGWAPGRHQLFVRGQDADGQWGPVSSAFLWVLDPAATATVSGSVTDVDSGLGLGATVSLGPFSVAADAVSGAYSLAVPAGTYELAVAVEGYGPRSEEALALGAGAAEQRDFALQPYSLLFADDVEGGDLGWTAEDTWAITDETAFSPTRSWTDSPGADYVASADTSLISPLLDLRHHDGVRLRFRHRHVIQQGYDFASVEISADGGATWQEVALFTNDSGGDWLPADLDLAALDRVPAARLRFRLVSNPGIQADGWHLDDLEVRALLVREVFADGFESGDLVGWSASAP